MIVDVLFGEGCPHHARCQGTAFRRLRLSLIVEGVTSR